MHNHSGEGDLGKTLTTRLCFHANKRISNDCLAASFLRAKGWGLDGGGTKPAELVRVCVCARGGHLLPPDCGAAVPGWGGAPFIHRPPWWGRQDDGLASSLCVEVFNILQESRHLCFQAWETHRTSPSWERCPGFSRPSNKSPAPHPCPDKQPHFSTPCPRSGHESLSTAHFQNLLFWDMGRCQPSEDSGSAAWCV